VVGECDAVIGQLNDGTLNEEQQRQLLSFDDRCSEPDGHDGAHVFRGSRRAVYFDAGSGDWEIK
jgi:hypothetical protein